MKKNIIYFVLLIIVSVPSLSYAQKNVEQWKLFEAELEYKSTGNPFTDVNLEGLFINRKDSIKVNGFYDGNDIFRVRFMPTKTGKWTYTIKSNVKALKSKGYVICTAATKDNHGIVKVSDKTHLSYADGTPYYPFGTTAYAWVHQSKELIDQTLITLADKNFNKIRMCVFPKSYDWNHNAPLLYPYEGTADTAWDYTRFNPAFFQNIEKQIVALDALGIEADLILFHPYDRWNFSKMDRENDERYLKYVIARFSAYKNVWWSLANEYDLIKSKKKDDWKHYLSLVHQIDPYRHLESIHYGAVMFDYKNPDITHLSLQLANTEDGRRFVDLYEKPVIFDEPKYEGNLPWEWGNLTGEELVNKYWIGICRGAYVSHGETYLTKDFDKMPEDSDEEMWWSKGGVLRGKSPARIKFLKEIMETGPAQLDPYLSLTDWMGYPVATYKEDYFLLYFRKDQPAQEIIYLPENKKYKIDIIDTWDMTITPVKGEFSGKSLVQLPGKTMIALRITKI